MIVVLLLLLLLLSQINGNELGVSHMRTRIRCCCNSVRAPTTTRASTASASILSTSMIRLCLSFTLSLSNKRSSNASVSNVATRVGIIIVSASPSTKNSSEPASLASEGKGATVFSSDVAILCHCQCCPRAGCRLRLAKNDVKVCFTTVVPLAA